ncbi:hypothetical protein V491_05476 [Pseudogymnoascus sp. VKM F-3775]|nr:hypothetical protein V491_05476 [Pseudogymnoascus sp. VKM F-3775]
MPSTRELESKRYAAPQSRGELSGELILTPSPFGDPRLDDEFFSTRMSNEATRRAFLGIVLKVLLQINFDVIQALALGTLPQEARGALKAYFSNDMISLGDTVPAVYVNYIVDKDGVPPTKAEIIEILSVMKEYLSDDSDDLVKQVDTQIGRSRMLWRYAYKAGTERAHIQFIKGMEKRLGLVDLGLVDATELTSDPDAEPASDPDATGATKPASDPDAADPDAADIANADVNTKTPSQVAETVYTQSDISQDATDQPIACGISEVGFSIMPYRRIQDHKKHTNSNLVMNLFEAAARYHFGNKYSIEGYVVARIVDPTLAGISEAVISRLACSYADGGGGFNAKLGGLNVNGVNHLPMILSDAKLNREAWITLEANEDMSNVEDERERVEKRTAYYKARIIARLERHNEVTDKLISTAEEVIFQKNRLANIRQKLKEQGEKWREFKLEADKSRDPDWLENIKKFCSDPAG